MMVLFLMFLSLLIFFSIIVVVSCGVIWSVAGLQKIETEKLSQLAALAQRTYWEAPECGQSPPPEPPNTETEWWKNQDN